MEKGRYFERKGTKGTKGRFAVILKPKHWDGAARFSKFYVIFLGPTLSRRKGYKLDSGAIGKAVAEERDSRS